jgi:hypothetical protein
VRGRAHPSERCVKDERSVTSVIALMTFAERGAGWILVVEAGAERRCVGGEAGERCETAL